MSWGDTPNPFSRVLAAGEPSAKSRFVRATKTLAVTLALTALLMAGGFFGKQFLLAQLIAGFDELDSAAKQNRLMQIADFGSDAVEPLVEKLAAEEDAVSASAFTLLQQMQNDWITLSPPDAQTAHNRLIRAITTTFCPPLQPGRPAGSNPVQRARASELVRQSVLEFSSAPAQSTDLLAAANRLLTELDAHASTEPTLVDSPVKLGAEKRSHSVAKVVQLSGSIRQSGWTDWPPGRAPTAQIVRSGMRQAKFDDDEQLNTPIAAATNLQALPPGVMAPLRQIMPRDASAARDANAALAPVLAARSPVGRLIQVAAKSDEEALATRCDAPLATLSEAALIGQLASPAADDAELARVELVERGFSKPQVELAANWSAAGPEERLQLVDSLAHSGQLESAPWLSVAFSDPDRRVRLRVASALEKTQDAAVLVKLRQQLGREADPHVAARIRRILDLF